jgi:hypothetical protein
MFDSNAMRELQYVAADRYQRNGGGGAHKVYATSKAYYDARGWKDLSKFEQACIEILHNFRARCELLRSDYAWEVRADRADVETFGDFPPSNPVGSIYHNVRDTF